MGLRFLLALCYMETRAWELRLTADREPGDDGAAPISFIRALMGAQALDRGRAMGLTE